MKIKVVVHDAEEGGFWAEVPAPFRVAPRKARPWTS
jgi:predicted RNase H-like HicB family nuclease